MPASARSGRTRARVGTSASAPGHDKRARADLEWPGELVAWAQKTPIALILIDEANAVVCVNCAFVALSGYSASQAQGKALEDLLSMATAVEPASAQSMSSSRPWRRCKLRNANGRELVCDVDCAAFASGQQLLSLLSRDDESALNADASAVPLPTTGSFDANVEFRLATQLAGVAMWRHDLRQQRVYYNARSAQLLGLPLRPDGLPVSEVRGRIHPDDLPDVLASTARALRSTEQIGRAHV